MKNALFILFFALLSASAAAHNGSIRGSVLDAETRSPLAGALVLLENTGRSTYADELGIYQFGDLEAGQYTLRISYLGYAPYTKVVEARDSETTTLFHYMERGSVELRTLEVLAEPNVQSKTISTLDVRLRPTNTAQDILRIVPGLFIAQHAGGGKAEQIFLRGFDIDHGTDIAINVDGIPVNMVSHAHGQGYADLHFLLPETVERVEFNKGPYYAAYGDLATAGYVGFQTKNALDRNTIRLQGGMFDTYSASGMFKILDKNEGPRPQHAYVASNYFFSNGYFDSPQAYDRFNFFGKYSGAVSDQDFLSVSLSAFSSRWDASGQIPQRAVEAGDIGFFGAIDDTEGGNTARSNLNLQHRGLLRDGSVLRNQFYLSKYDFELYSNFTFFLNDSLDGDQIRQKENRNLLGYNGSYSRRDQFLGLQWATEAGLQLRYDATRNSELSNTTGRQTLRLRRALGDINQINAGIYLNETLHATPWLLLNAGLRFDQFQFLYVDKMQAQRYDRRIATDQVVSPKLNVYATLNERLQLFAHVGNGFHSNDARVVVAQRAQQTLPKALGYETGIIFKPLPRMVLTANLWRLRLQQEFVYVGDEAVVEPSGATTRSGLDLSLRYQLNSWLYADADLNYTLARADDTPEAEAYIPLAPVWTSIGGLSFQHPGGLNGSLRYRYLGDRPANEDNSVRAEGYFLADALLNYTRRSFEVGISVENLLGRRWKEAQFDTESRLRGELEPVSEIHFTPGTPFNLQAHVSFFW